MKTTTTTLLFLLFSVSLFAQINQEWATTYTSPFNDGIDIANSIALDNEGNVYITGQCMINGINQDYATIKYNSVGVEQWVATYNGPGNDEDVAVSIAVDEEGGVYVTGYSEGEGTGLDYATIKYNSDGEEQWVARYASSSNSSNDRAVGLVLDTDGNIIVTGTGTGTGTGANYITIKYNPVGQEQWIAYYNGTYSDVPKAITVDALGNIYVTGMSNGSGTNSNYVTVKYSSSGATLWEATYDGQGTYGDEPTDIAVDINGNVYVTGNSWGNSSSGDIATVKYNSQGVEQWSMRYDGSIGKADFASALAVDMYENVYVTGASYITEDLKVFITIKYDSNGVEMWIALYDDTVYWAGANAITLDNDGNIYVTGTSYQEAGIGRVYTTVKYNTVGVEQWAVIYNPGNNDDLNNVASSIAVDVDGNVFITGKISSPTTYLDMATVKYSQPTGTDEISSETQDKYYLSQNFPNPFSLTTTIHYTMQNPGFASLKVYDVTGKIVGQLVNARQPAGDHQVQFDATGLPAGIYYYQLRVGKQTQTKKMILMN